MGSRDTAGHHVGDRFDRSNNLRGPAGNDRAVPCGKVALGCICGIHQQGATVGAFADGRGLVAALALGAEGINMGTRFCATQEAQIHENVKQAYVAADGRGTNLLFRNLCNTARVGKSPISDKVVEMLAQPGAQFDDVRPYVAGTAGRQVLEQGDMEAGIYWASMAQGLIYDIPTCAELIDRIMTEARAIIHGRLAQM